MMTIREVFGGNLTEREGGLVTEERLVPSMKIEELKR